MAKKAKLESLPLGPKKGDNKGPNVDKQPNSPDSPAKSQSDTKQNLIKKFRNSAQQPLTPIPMGATIPPVESIETPQDMEPVKEVTKEPPTVSSGSKLKSKFKRIQ